MDRQQGEARIRRMREEAAASEQSQESSEDDEGTATVRTGATRAIDADDLSTIRREQDLTQDDSSGRLQADVAGGFNPDARLDQPGALPESVEVTDVAPDGTHIGRRLTSPTGEAIGGSRLSDSIESRAGELGGDALGTSRLDPLGMLEGPDATGVASPSDREVERALGRHDGSHISAEPTTLDVLATAADPKSNAPTPRPDPPQTNLLGQGTLNALATATDPKSLKPSKQQPDPTGEDLVITEEAAAAAVEAHASGGDPGIFRPTEEGSVAGYATNLADNDPQNLTNYGPEGPQNVQMGENWAPPTDLLFDPPPEGGSAGMTGAASAVADPAGALDGSTVGSSTPEIPPDPPPTPPGDDPDQGPLGPPGGGGDGDS